MKTHVQYGINGIIIDVPDHATIVEPLDIRDVDNEEQAVMEALRNPIGTAPLKDMVKSTDKVVIVISDITRPTPNEKLVPWLLNEMKHVPLENITIINGT